MLEEASADGVYSGLAKPLHLIVEPVTRTVDGPSPEADRQHGNEIIAPYTTIR